MDAASEAYIRLYHTDLINDNLLPSPRSDEEATKTYTEIAKRPSTAVINRNFNRWPAVAAAWQLISTLYTLIGRI